MAFKMDFDKAKLEQKPVPAGIYTVRMKGFKPETSSKGDSVNLNPKVEIINNPEFEGKGLFVSLNSKMESFHQDFVHSFGLEMDTTNPERPAIPGIFDADQSIFKVDDPKTWRYEGPLISKTAQWEVGVKEYKGRPTNEVRQFTCAVPNCAERFPDIRHSLDMGR